MQWFYAINGQRMGPISDSEFQRLVGDGSIQPDTLGWKHGMPAWLPFAQLAAVPTGVAQTSANPIAATGGAADGVTSASDDTAICAVDGKRYPKREMVQYEGRWISAINRDVFFQRLREGIAQPMDFNYAGFWIRFVAKFIDGIILFFTGSLIGLIFGVGAFAMASYGPRNPNQLPAQFARMGLSALCNIGIALLYHWFFISRYSATPGKMALDLKIIRSDGSKLSTGRIIGRYFAEWLSGMILYIGYIMAGSDEEKRTLHDRICDTRVVKKQ